MERGFTNFGLFDIVIIIFNHQNLLFHEMHSLSATAHIMQTIGLLYIIYQINFVKQLTFEMKNSMAISYSCFCCNRNENIKSTEKRDLSHSIFILKCLQLTHTL